MAFKKNLQIMVIFSTFDKIKKCDQTDQFLTVKKIVENAKIKRFKCDIFK